MYNVDTLSLTMNFNRKLENSTKLDWNYIYRIDRTMKGKLVLYSKDKANRDREIRYSKLSNENKELLSRLTKRKQRAIYWHGEYDRYIFTYNENWHNLTIMLPNFKLEELTADAIKYNVNKAIMTYFNLQQKELNELVLNRLDIHCDYDFGEDEDYDIIRNILEKAPDKFYTYQKKLILDSKDGYIMKYLAVRKNEYIEDLMTIENNLLRLDKEKQKNENNE